MPALIRACGLALALVLAGLGRSAAEPEGEQSCAIAVEMTGFRSDRGQALIALFSSARGFPDKPQQAIRRVPVTIRNRKARVVLRRLPPGTYAVGVLHDEDGNQKMKAGFLGRPQEGYGASRDARGRFGPPRFEDARIALRPGQTLVAPIRMHYP